MAKKDDQLDDGIIDLTELIEPGTTGGKAAAAYAKASTVEEAPVAEEDFEAILAQTAPPAANRKVDPDENLDMSGMGGIDNLLESLDIPPQPRESAKPAQKAADPADLDSVLDDLLAPPAKAAKAQQPEEEPAPEPAAEEKPAPRSDLDADLDDILASFDEPAAPKAAKPKAEPVADLSSDLDDILGDAGPEEPTRPAPKAPPANDDLDDLLGDLEAPQKKAPQPAPEPAPEPEAGPKPQAGADVLDDFDDLLDGLDEPAAPTPPTAKTAEAVEDDIPGVADLADLDEPGAPMDISHAPAPAQPVLPAEAPGKDNSHQVMIAQSWAPDMITGICQGIAKAQNSADRETLQEFSRELGAQSAHVQDIGGQMSQLGKRVLACESKLAASRARIATLEKGMESAAAFEDLLKDGSPLHAGFMALISTAVSNALKSFASGDNAELAARVRQLEQRLAEADEKIASLESRPAPSGDESQLDARIERINASVENAASRLADLEKRVEDIAAASEAEMEKAASRTVAKVLHEEISKLMQE